MKSISLDLGCGANPKNPFGADAVYGIDIREDIGNNIYKADLVLESIPFPDSHFDYVTAHDFIEHIPRVIYMPQRKNPFVDLMSEIWRVLKLDGKFYSHTPAFPHMAAFSDPTHVNIITENTYPMYFDDVHRWGATYGFRGAFKIESQRWDGVYLESILIKKDLQ
jgi:SAM-dependent methyltransferase